MPMRMVNIRYMRMRVLLQFVTMPVAVFAYRHGIVQVPVVPVVVAVRMFMIQCLMFVFVLV